MDLRTNNNIESYHRHILTHLTGSAGGGAFPNAWRFLGKFEPLSYHPLIYCYIIWKTFAEGLKKLEKNFRVEYAQYLAGSSRRWQERWSYRRHDRLVKAFMRQHTPGDQAAIRLLLERARHHIMSIYIYILILFINKDVGLHLTNFMFINLQARVKQTMTTMSLAMMVSFVMHHCAFIVDSVKYWN